MVAAAKAESFFILGLVGVGAGHQPSSGGLEWRSGQCLPIATIGVASKNKGELVDFLRSVEAVVKYTAVVVKKVAGCTKV